MSTIQHPGYVCGVPASAHRYTMMCCLSGMHMHARACEHPLSRQSCPQNVLLDACKAGIKRAVGLSFDATAVASLE
jgi:hypothetical protein